MGDIRRGDFIVRQECSQKYRDETACEDTANCAYHPPGATDINLENTGTLELAGTTVFRNQVRNQGGGRLEVTPGATVRFDSTEQTTIEGDGIESFGEIEVGTGGMRVEGRLQSFGKLNVESRITFEARAVVEACVASAEDAEQSVVATCAGALEGATGADARATACAAAAACTYIEARDAPEESVIGGEGVALGASGRLEVEADTAEFAQAGGGGATFFTK